MYDAGNDVGMGKSIRQEQMLPTPVSVSNNNMKYNNDIYEVSLQKLLYFIK